MIPQFFYFFSESPTNSKLTEFIQYLVPVGGGPSLKTWPRCESQRLQTTSILSIPWDESRL